MAGLETPTSGTVLIDGKPASKPNEVLIAPHQRGLAMLFQDLALWPNLSVIENVRLGLSGTGLSRAETRSRAEDALALCDIRELADRKPGRLSGGQQQRAALARAMATRPRFLLLDEPFAGLDLETKDKLLTEIGAIAQSQSITVLLVTHDPLEAAAISRNAIVLDHGRIIESGSLDDVLRKPRSRLLRLFGQHLARLPVRSTGGGPSLDSST